MLTTFDKIFIVMQIFNTIIGSVAEGKFYFPRPYLDLLLWKALRKGESLLISAPRRIGKSSFLINICNQEMSGFLVKYHNTESVNRSNEFFKRLYKSLLEELSTHQKIWEDLTEMLRRNKVEKIGSDGIELKGIDLNYFEEFRRLIQKIEIDERLVFVIDEFSETCENILNDQGIEEAKIFLHQNREIRQDKIINSKIQFIYSGSIGLGNIAERINAIKSINDLHDFPMNPLTNEEALDMINRFTVTDELVFDLEIKQYLLDRIKWLMPYYIQIILDEIETILFGQETKLEITVDIINQAIDESLKKRNYFEHWHTRLRTAFQAKEYTFAKEMLNEVAKSEKGISKTQVFDLAHKNGIEDEYNIICRALEYDGYIYLNQNNLFIFNSPLLRIWWERNISI